MKVATRSPSRTDSQTSCFFRFAITYTTVVMNGKRKVIRNYANAGPTTLWAIEQLIDSLMTKVKWGETQKLEEQKK